MPLVEGQPPPTATPVVTPKRRDGEAALARRSSDVRTAGEGAAADDHAAGLWMERSTCGPVAMVRPCWLSLLPDDLLLPILSFVDEVDAALMGAPHVHMSRAARARRLCRHARATIKTIPTYRTRGPRREAAPTPPPGRWPACTSRGWPDILQKQVRASSRIRPDVTD